MIVLDRVMRRIIDSLQREGRQSVQQLAQAAGMSATPVWRRVKELERAGVIRREVVLMDREKLGLAICVWAHVSLVRHTDGAVEDFERLALTSPEIMECASITGEADYVIKVVVPDMKAYDRFLQERLFKLKGVSSIRTNVVLREVKYETALPLPPGPA
ncbi:MAG: Lrp/AsnC family transcriptional regulator [Burkholderiales bacterium]|nr:Lrp/AsnC family transcriptional regulator [Burkholderiales bacterium]